MKKLIYILSMAGFLAVNTSCLNELDTLPTDQVGSSEVLKDVTSAQAAMNGVYRMLYTAGWSQGWGSENSSVNG